VLVAQQARDEEEPEDILGRRAIARDLDGKVGRDDVHEEKARAEEQQHRHVERVGADGERRFAVEPAAQDPEAGKEHQRFVPR